MNERNIPINVDGNGCVEVRSPFGIYKVPSGTFYEMVKNNIAIPTALEQPVILNWEERVKKQTEIENNSIPIVEEPIIPDDIPDEKPKQTAINNRFANFDIIGSIDGITFMAHKSISMIVSRLSSVLDTERFIASYCNSNDLILGEPIFAMSAYTDSANFEFKPAESVYNINGEKVPMTVYHDKTGIHCSR